MRLSQFWGLMEDEFGVGYARVLAGSLVLSPYQQTAEGALASGVSPRDVWLTVCDQQEVPEERRLGRDIQPKP